MDEKNITSITFIHLVGCATPKNIGYLVFFILIIVYCWTVCGNLLIIMLVSYSKSLHSPMYFFLSQLSLSDILIVTDILPNMLYEVLVKESLISFFDCLTQFYFFCVSEVLQCLLLTVMSYDRYLAICKPLHYISIMSHHACWIIIITFWAISILIELILPLGIMKLQFCGPNIIDHFFCDLHPILELSCSDTTGIELEVTLLGVFFVVIPFYFIVVSYVYIIITIFKIPTITSRHKVFSTCSSHLTVVSIFYITVTSVYLVPTKGQSLNISKFMSLLCIVGTPLLNPIIYSMRNKDLKQAVGKKFNNFLCLPFYSH